MNKMARIGTGIGTIAIAVAALLVFQNCGAGTKPASVSNNEEQVSNEPPTLARTDFMTGLNNPWDIAFAPGGVMLFTEKCRGLSARHADGSISRLFGSPGSTVVAADLFCEGQSGMHG